MIRTNVGSWIKTHGTKMRGRKCQPPLPLDLTSNCFRRIMRIRSKCTGTPPPSSYILICSLLEIKRAECQSPTPSPPTADSIAVYQFQHVQEMHTVWHPYNIHGSMLAGAEYPTIPQKKRRNTRHLLVANGRDAIIIAS